MQEEIIYLSSLDDNDVISIGATAYKIKRIRDVTENLLKPTYKDFSASLNALKANNLGICSSNNSTMLEIYSNNYCSFEYLKIGDSNWKTGKVKIYLSAFLYSKQSESLEQNKSICYYPQLVFEDEDVVSFQKDCLCKMQSIKNAFKSISTNNNFVSKVMEQVVISFSDFTGSNLFRDGKECELLRLGSLTWEPLFFGIQFTIDAVEDNPINDLSTLVNKHSSPLDEIRKAAEYNR